MGVVVVFCDDRNVRISLFGRDHQDLSVRVRVRVDVGRERGLDDILENVQVLFDDSGSARVSDWHERIGPISNGKSRNLVSMISERSHRICSWN
jgi:hypothetical protein